MQASRQPYNQGNHHQPGVDPNGRGTSTGGRGSGRKKYRGGKFGENKINTNKLEVGRFDGIHGPLRPPYRANNGPSSAPSAVNANSFAPDSVLSTANTHRMASQVFTPNLDANANPFQPGAYHAPNRLSGMAPSYVPTVSVIHGHPPRDVLARPVSQSNFILPPVQADELAGSPEYSPFNVSMSNHPSLDAQLPPLAMPTSRRDSEVKLNTITTPSTPSLYSKPEGTPGPMSTTPTVQAVVQDSASSSARTSPNVASKKTQLHDELAEFVNRHDLIHLAVLKQEDRIQLQKPLEDALAKHRIDRTENEKKRSNVLEKLGYVLESERRHEKEVIHCFDDFIKKMQLSNVQGSTKKEALMYEGLKSLEDAKIHQSRVRSYGIVAEQLRNNLEDLNTESITSLESCLQAIYGEIMNVVNGKFEMTKLDQTVSGDEARKAIQLVETQAAQVSQGKENGKAHTETEEETTNKAQMAVDTINAEAKLSEKKDRTEIKDESAKKSETMMKGNETIDIEAEIDTNKAKGNTNVIKDKTVKDESGVKAQGSTQGNTEIGTQKPKKKWNKSKTKK